MDKYFVEPTKDTPQVDMDPEGTIKINGKAMPEHPIKFFTPIYEWCKQYDKDSILIDIDLEYFNTSVSKCLLDFFKIFELRKSVKNVEVNWRYETGDEDTQESGEIYQDLLPTFKFNFIEYAEQFH